MTRCWWLFVCGFCFAFCAISQETYNNCIQSLELCPSTSATVNNYAANKTLCTDCEDDITTSCSPATNSIWMHFKTNETGGKVTVSINSINFKNTPNFSKLLAAFVLHAKIPCDASSYKFVSPCFNTIGNAINLETDSLDGNTTYYVYVTGVLEPGLSNPAEAAMEVSISGVGVERLNPSIHIFQNKSQICKNEIVRLSSTIENFQNADTYKWYKNDTLVAVTDSSFLDIATLHQSDVVRVENTAFTNCPVTVSDQTVPFSVYSFQLNAGKDTTIYEGQQIQILANSDGTSFLWKPEIYLSNHTTLQPIVSPHQTITYSIEAQKNGCALSDQMTVYVLKKQLVPNNCFSPNGDNINDTWEIPFLDDFPSCDIKIFTRWGQTVYETTGYNYKKAWDGTHNGSVVDEGVYFYVIQLRDAHYAEPLKGTITIIK